MRNKHLFILFCIVVFGFILRIYKVADIPSGFFADEASIGYNAHTIFTRGIDEYGTPIPLFFRAFGEYKSPVQIYTTIPFVALFGLNEFSVRLPSAIFGTLTVLAIYFLTKTLCKNKAVSLLAAFLLAISPWHVHFSRVAFETMPFVFFTVLGVYLFLKVQNNTKFLPISVISFVFAIYSYFPARLFIPLFGLCLFVVYFKFFFRHKRETFISFFMLLLLLAPLIQHMLSPLGTARWKQVSIFSNPSENQSLAEHILYNYISHFSFDFLFLKGDIDMPGQFITRHSIHGMGQLYLFQLPLIIFGFTYFIRTKQHPTLYLFIFWLLLYPTGSMFTIDKSVQATRSIIGVVPLQIISAIGLWYFFIILNKVKNLNQLHRSTVVIIIATFIFSSFINYLHLYFVKYPLYSSDFWGWQYGAREIVAYFVLKETEYDELIMAPEFNAPDIFFKFYAPNACKNCRVDHPHNMRDHTKKQLFAVTPSYLTQHPFLKLQTFRTIYYPNKTIAFQIGEIVQ